MTHTMQPTITGMSILSPQELQRLEQLRLVPHRRFAGRMRGERISRQKGISVEFADYREYTVGDDLRHLDWNILARLDRPTIRTYQDEDDLAIYILLDSSASMDFGQPTKFIAAQKLAVALGFVGLCGQDYVTPVALGRPMARSMRGRASLTKLSMWASGIQPSDSRGFADGVNQFVRGRGIRPGMVICLADGLDPGAQQAVRSIGARGHELLFVQILSDVDIDPDIEGDLRLIDSESDTTVDITANSDALLVYKQNLAEHCRTIEQAVSSVGGRYVRTQSNASAIDLITGDLRHRGVIE